MFSSVVAPADQWAFYVALTMTSYVLLFFRWGGFYSPIFPRELMTTERGSTDGDHGRERKAEAQPPVEMLEKVFIFTSTLLLLLHPETPIPVDESHQLFGEPTTSLS
jgi:hypothetical protein